MIKYSNIKYFNKVSNKILLPLNYIFLIMSILSAYEIYKSPYDYQQKELVKILYIHVSFATLSIGIYVIIGILSFITITWKSMNSYIYAQSLSHIGIIYAILTLITGMLWGKPSWGTYWVWDARLTSMLLLTIIYLGYIMVSQSNNIHKTKEAASIIAIIGLINIPIIKFSVNIWYNLHQGHSIFTVKGNMIHHTILKPLIYSFITLSLLTIIIFIIRTKTIIIQFKKQNKLYKNC